MLKSAIIATVATLLSSPAFADMPPSAIYSVKLVYSTRTLTGYVDALLDEHFDPAKPEALEILRKRKNSWFIEDIEETKAFTEEPLLISDKSAQRIDTSNLVAVSSGPGKLSGTMLSDSSITGVSTRLLQLLRTKPPLFHCAVSYSDVPQHNFLSWNPKADTKKLEDFCSRTYETRPSEAERKEVLSQPDVFDVQIMGD